MKSVNPTRRLSQCEGKDKFDSFAQAEDGISNRLRHKVRPYNCQVCRFWHLGNVNGSRQKRLTEEGTRNRSRHVED